MCLSFSLLGVACIAASSRACPRTTATAAARLQERLVALGAHAHVLSIAIETAALFAEILLAVVGIVVHRHSLD